MGSSPFNVRNGQDGLQISAVISTSGWRDKQHSKHSNPKEALFKSVQNSV